MKLIGDRHPIDLAFLPIGDNFTMGPDDAAYAAELLGAKKGCSHSLQHISANQAGSS